MGYTAFQKRCDDNNKEDTRSLERALGGGAHCPAAVGTSEALRRDLSELVPRHMERGID